MSNWTRRKSGATAPGSKSVDWTKIAQGIAAVLTLVGGVSVGHEMAEGSADEIAAERRATARELAAPVREAVADAVAPLTREVEQLNLKVSVLYLRMRDAETRLDDLAELPAGVTAADWLHQKARAANEATQVQPHPTVRERVRR